MKKMFSKVSAFVLAFMMIFALGACGDTNMVEVGSAGEALTGAADAMLGQDGITVTLDGSISMLGKLETVSLSNIGLSGSFKMAKKNNDIDFDASAAVKVGTMNMDFGAIKVGDTMYFNSFETGGEWKSETADPITLPNALPAQVADMLKSFDLGKLEKGKDSYKLTASLDYGAPLKKVQNFLKENGAKTLNEYLFPGFTDEQNTELANKLNGLVEDLDTTTVPAFIAKIDAILDYVKGDKPAKTVKGLADSLFDQAGITAKDIRDAIVKNMPNMEQALPQPTAGQTAYDYILLFVAQAKVGDIVDMFQGIIGGIGGGESNGPGVPNTPEITAEEDDGQDTEQGGGMMTFYSELVKLLTSKGEGVPTISELYDRISFMAVGMIYQSEMGEYLDMVLGAIADAEVAKKLSLEEGETYISWVNLQNMVFGDNKVELIVEFNGSDLTLKSIKFVVKNDIKFKVDTETKQLTKVDININVNFAYGAVTVTAPDMTEQAAA